MLPAKAGPIRRFGDVTCYSDADRAESCTALVEEANGVIGLVHWNEHGGDTDPLTPSAVQAARIAAA